LIMTNLMRHSFVLMSMFSFSCFLTENICSQVLANNTYLPIMFWSTLFSPAEVLQVATYILWKNVPQVWNQIFAFHICSQFIHSDKACSLGWKAMAESTIHWFVVRKKHYSLAEKVRLIRQANRADIKKTSSHGESNESNIISQLVFWNFACAFFREPQLLAM
jgi:hypothetical protein